MPKAEAPRIQKYRPEWETEPWAKGWLQRAKAPYDTNKAFCKLCKKELMPKKSNLKLHTEADGHKESSKQIVPEQPQITSFASQSTSIKAELNVVALIARCNLSFNFLDSLMKTLHGIADDSNAIKNMTCNRTKGTYLMTHCLFPYSHENLVKDIKESGAFSILCDKATDITNKKFLCLNVRFTDISTKKPTTRFYRLLELEEGDANGVFGAINSALREDGLEWSLVCGYASDGENLMQGINNSVLTRFQEAAPGLFVLKCYCHSFSLVAEHANKCLSSQAEQVVQDIYNYFKMSPNRQKSLEEFQEFASTEPHKILKPCQTRWLSLHQCCRRILKQWPALLLFFTSEVFERRSAGADRILQALKTPYIKATIEFCDFVLGDLCSANLMLQSNSFQLHNLIPECERIIQMFCSNFRKPIRDIKAVELDDETQWVPVENIYPGLNAAETIADMLPHERESFLKRCRNWYREAVQQILNRIDFHNPLFPALKDLDPRNIMTGAAKVSSGAVIARQCTRIVSNLGADLQVLDREWRSMLIDEKLNSSDTKCPIEEFWRRVSEVPAYSNIGSFILAVLSLPQSTAEVERTFSKVNNNKTKLRNHLAVTSLEAIIGCSESFKDNFEVNPRLLKLHQTARQRYQAKFSSHQEPEDVASFE